jgi:hypothetical protein
MATDYIPQSYANLNEWLDQIKTEITARATRLNVSPADLTAFTGHLDAIGTPLKDVLVAQTALDDATGRVETALKAHLPEVRREIKHIKSSAAYTVGDGDAMQIIGSADSFDSATYQPGLDAKTYVGYVRLTGRKLGADAMNLYVRMKGQSEWKLLVARRSKFPFDDDSPLAVAGTPEVREYRAIGVVSDDEVGQPSDIVSVVYGG